MGLKDFQILLDNNWSTYCPGQTITGHIIVTLDTAKKVRSIYLKIVGESNTCWSVANKKLNEEGHYERDTEIVSAHEEYFNNTIYLYGSDSTSESSLQSGMHKYSFTYELPQNLPSSFESDFGHVRYTIKGIIDRPWKFDHEVITAFTVISLFDLNQEPKASKPVQQTMTKTYCCLCCRSPPLTIDVSLPVQGYAPGQSIPVKINAGNKTGIAVDKIKLTLLKTVTYHAKTPRNKKRIEEFVISESSKGPFQQHATSSYVQELDVPPVPPSELKHCRIINLEYTLKVETCFSRWYHRNMNKRIKIYIGTVPLLNYQMSTAPTLNIGEEEIVKQAIDVNDSAPKKLNSPFYQEAIFAARSLRKPNESKYVIGVSNSFAPKYPVYEVRSKV